MLKKIIQLYRLIHINFVLGRYGLGRLILSTGKISTFSPIRFLIYLNLGHWISHRRYSRGEALRRSLETLGPIFVKFGQAVSTRNDLLPDDIVKELALLQDKVPSFPSKLAIKTVEQDYGKSLAELFKDFDANPIASASIAQVHAATLHDESNVVVKVLRPNIEKIIHRDVALMYMFARLIMRYWKDAKRLRIIDVVAEFERTILHELDLLREAANASTIRRNFLDSKMLYIPEVHWSYAREKVIVQERISGIPISNITELKRQGVNFKVLAERGVEIFFTQVFRDCFFHADMHPGNLFVYFEDPNDPRYVAVDFGIMGSLNNKDQHYLAENFLAFFRRDYRRVAELHVESGWVPYDTRVDEFEAAIRTVCEPIFERPLVEISYGQVLLRLFQTGRQFNMEVQPQLILLQKTLIAIEGLGRKLYPELDLWNTAKPYLENWLKQRVRMKTLYHKVRSNALRWSEQMPELPNLVFDALYYVKEKKIQDSLQAEKNRTRNKSWHIVLLSLLTGAAVGAVAVWWRLHLQQ